MAQFIPKTSEEILRDAIDYLYLNTNLSDFNVGSVIRTILEVMSFEDANQYYQMVTILESFFLKTAVGPTLDDRAAEYSVTRLPATASVGDVVFLDTHLQRTFLVNSVVAGDIALHVEDASIFGAPPFMVQLGEGGSATEQVTVSAVNVGASTLTVSQVSNPHESAATGVDELDNLSSLVCMYNIAAADRLIPTGITLRAEPTNVTFEIECMTVEVGLHRNGFFTSDPVKVRSNATGVSSNIPERRLNQLAGGAPYSGAGVSNLDSISGGREAESDGEFRERIRQHVAGLSSGTVAAILDKLFTTTDADTGTIVTRAKLIEDFENNVIHAYIDDASSSGIADSEERHEQDTLAVLATIGSDKIILKNISGFPVSVTLSNKSFIVVDPAGAKGVGPIVSAYSVLTTSSKTLGGLLVTPTENWPENTVISSCEVISLSSKEDRKYYQIDKYPLGDDAFLLFVAGGGTGPAVRQKQVVFNVPLVGDEDFLINEATGQIEFLKGRIPVATSGIFAIYENYTALLKEAQKVLDGDLRDVPNYPGVRSAGVKILTRPAGRTPMDVIANITTDSALTDIDTATFLAKQIIVSYVNNLGIGETLIVAEIVERVMGILGVTNVKILDPQDDVTPTEGAAWYAKNITVV